MSNGLFNYFNRDLFEQAMLINDCFNARSLIITAALISGLGLVTHATAQESGYHQYLVDLNSKTLTVLGTLGKGSIEARDINNAGQVVGTDYSTVGSSQAFVTGPDGMGLRDLGNLGGGPAFATSINDAGQVVGASWTTTLSEHAFITSPEGTGIRDIDTRRDYSYSEGGDINAAGQVAGSFAPIPGSNLLHAFITNLDGTGMRDLGKSGSEHSVATGINAAGRVVGFFFTDYNTAEESPPQAFITGPDGMGRRDLGTLGGELSYALGINDAGQVTGYSTTAEGDYHAFITGSNGMSLRDLGTLGDHSSFATGINETGQVIGDSFTAEGDHHAFITGPNGEGMMDLNSLVDPSSSVVLITATAINNQGQVIALGLIPEPDTYVLMLAGLGLIGFVVRRKKA